MNREDLRRYCQLADDKIHHLAEKISKEKDYNKAKEMEFTLLHLKYMRDMAARDYNLYNEEYIPAISNNTYTHMMKRPRPIDSFFKMSTITALNLNHLYGYNTDEYRWAAEGVICGRDFALLNMSMEELLNRRW